MAIKPMPAYLAGAYLEPATFRCAEKSEGRLAASGDIDYKAWNSSKAHEFLTSQNPLGLVVYVKGKINEWSGNKSIILDSVEIIDSDLEGIDISELYETKYDINKNEEDFSSLLQSNLSEKGFVLFNLIYNKIGEQFKKEFAAVKMHDAYRGGLLAHTLKMLKILNFVWETYPNISSSIDKDLAYIGLALHDIGKIKEYNNGTKSDIHWATHNFLGQEILFEFKNDIIETFDIEFYYRLQAIIMQHHGEFGEPCHTKEAYLVHLVDMFESRLEIFEEALPSESPINIDFGKYKLN